MPCLFCFNEPCKCPLKRKGDELDRPFEKRRRIEETTSGDNGGDPWGFLGGLEDDDLFEPGESFDFQFEPDDFRREAPLYEPVPDDVDLAQMGLLSPPPTEPFPSGFEEWDPWLVFDDPSGIFLRAPDDIYWSERIVYPPPLVTPLDDYHHRRGEMNTVVREPWRIGVVTWNINHYRDAKVDDKELRVEFVVLVRNTRRAVAYDPSSFGEALRSVLVEQDRQSVLDRLKDFVETEDTRDARRIRGCVREASSAEAWAAALEALETYLKKKKKSKQLAGVKRRLRQLASDTYFTDRLDYIRRRIQRAQLWIVQAQRLAEIDRVELRMPEEQEVNRPDSAEKAFGRFNAAFQAAKKSFAVLKGELKRRAIVLFLGHMFTKNDWLDAVVLQEVNAFSGLQRWIGDDATRERYPILAQLGVEPGPHLIGGKGALDDISVEDDGGDDEEDVDDEIASDGEDDEGEAKTGRGRQHEYYPILFRKDRLAYTRSFVLDTKGDESSEKECRWDKAKGVYRPIVVHELLPVKGDDKPVYVAAVHTTPGARPGQKADREFDRRNEFEQLKAAFATISTRSLQGQRWIVGGDYYLSDESIAQDPTELSKDEIRQRLDRRSYDQQLEGINRKRRTGKIKFTELVELEPKKLVQKLETLEMTGRAKLKGLLLPTSKLEVVRHILEVTFKKALGAELGTAQPVSGSNWHDVELLHRPRAELGSKGRAEFFATARVADLFVYGNKHFKTWEVGLVHPDGKLVLADSENTLSTSQFWAMVSDHFPVGAYFSVEENDEALQRAVRTEAEQVDAARWMERYRRAFLLHKRGTEQGEIELTVPGSFEPRLTELESWLGAIADLVELGRVKGKGGELTVDVKLHKYRRERLERGSQVRVWYDKDWYGRRLFDEGDAKGFWAVLDQVVPSERINPNDYAGEGNTQPQLINEFNSMDTSN